jgi:hypothetical protein
MHSNENKRERKIDIEINKRIEISPKRFVLLFLSLFQGPEKRATVITITFFVSLLPYGGQFHQHFMRAFFVQNFGAKNHTAERN